MLSTLSLLAASALLIAGVATQSPLTNDPKWAYSGCYTAPQGHILDYFKMQNLTSSPTIETCLAACSTRFAALGAGSCYCSTPRVGLPPTLKQLPDSNCTSSCASSADEACGGPLEPTTKEPSALSLYDSVPPAPVEFPNWKYDGCVEKFSSLVNFTHVATLGDLTVEGCLNACDTAGLSYTRAGLSGMACYCSSAAAPKTIIYVDNSICSFSCHGNEAEACGGSFTSADPSVSLYERTNGPADPKNSVIISETGMLMTRTTSATAEPSSTAGNGGRGGGNTSGAVKTGSGTATATGAEKTSSSAADAVYVTGDVGGLVGLLLGVVGWVLAVV